MDAWSPYCLHRVWLLSVRATDTSARIICEDKPNLRKFNAVTHKRAYNIKLLKKPKLRFRGRLAAYFFLARIGSRRPYSEMNMSGV
jgi:hypothetical protein